MVSDFLIWQQCYRLYLLGKSVPRVKTWTLRSIGMSTVLFTRNYKMPSKIQKSSYNWLDGNVEETVFTESQVKLHHLTGVYLFHFSLKMTAGIVPKIPVKAQNSGRVWSGRPTRKPKPWLKKKRTIGHVPKSRTLRTNTSRIGKIKNRVRVKKLKSSK